MRKEIRDRIGRMIAAGFIAQSALCGGCTIQQLHLHVGEKHTHEAAGNCAAECRDPEAEKSIEIEVP